MKLLPVLLFLLFVLLSVTQASGSIIATTGAINYISPPPSIAPDVLESPTDIFLFDEQQGLELPSDINVNITEAGLYEGSVAIPAVLTPGTISAGTTVNSYFLHSDTLWAYRLLGSINIGSVTFDSEIIGVIVYGEPEGNHLDATDAILGNPGTTYPTNVVARGLEFDENVDYVILSEDLRTLSVQMQVFQFGDSLRVLTALPVPEPSSLLLLGTGLIGCIGLRRKFKR